MPWLRIPGYVAGPVRSRPAVSRGVAEPVPLPRGPARAREPVHAGQRTLVQPRRCAAARI